MIITNNHYSRIFFFFLGSKNGLWNCCVRWTGQPKWRHWRDIHCSFWRPAGRTCRWAVVVRNVLWTDGILFKKDNNQPSWHYWKCSCLATALFWNQRGNIFYIIGAFVSINVHLSFMFSENDRVVQVNAIPMEGANHSFAVGTLRKCGKVAKIVSKNCFIVV